MFPLKIQLIAVQYVPTAELLKDIVDSSWATSTFAAGTLNYLQLPSSLVFLFGKNSACAMALVFSFSQVREISSCLSSPLLHRWESEPLWQGNQR
jgi:hypothetical protein